MELIGIASFSSLFEAEMAKNILEDAGHTVQLTNERMMSIYPSMAADMYMIQLMVPKSSEQKARELLQELDDAYITKEILQNEAAWLQGHFLLTSGKHSDRYIEKIRVLQNPAAVHTLCKRLAKRLKGYDFDTVIGPAYGGIVLAFEVARILEKPFIFCQRKDGEMSIRSGFDLSNVKKAVIVEDILSTGSSIKELLVLLKNKGIEPAGIGLLVDRSAGLIDFGIPLEALISMDVPLWEPEACELCENGIPLTRPGSSDKK